MEIIDTSTMFRRHCLPHTACQDANGSPLVAKSLPRVGAAAMPLDMECQQEVLFASATEVVAVAVLQVD